jgi:hypothetical protein
MSHLTQRLHVGTHSPAGFRTIQLQVVRLYRFDENPGRAQLPWQIGVSVDEPNVWSVGQA